VDAGPGSSRPPRPRKPPRPGTVRSVDSPPPVGYKERMNPSELDTWREAAAIAGHVREYVASLMRPGAKLIDLSLEGHRRIEALGGKPAFPLQISVNHVAAHYCAYVGDETELAENDLVKVDCGVHVDGYVADTA